MFFPMKATMIDFDFGPTWDLMDPLNASAFLKDFFLLGVRVDHHAGFSARDEEVELCPIEPFRFFRVVIAYLILSFLLFSGIGSVLTFTTVSLAILKFIYFYSAKRC